MTKNEKLLAAHLLERAAEEYGRHGCNDFPEEEYMGMSEEEVKDFTIRYEFWNSNGREEPREPYHLPDFAVMGFLAHLLKEEAIREILL